MKIFRDSHFSKGWFIGAFKPTLLDTKEFEASIKYYKTGEREARHFHKIAREFTVVGSGLFLMNGELLTPGAIVEIEPGESADFECLKEGVNFVIKTPSVIGDKYLSNSNE